ncbi:16S rRNA (guanine(527)-N(7))-methyltransferase RsmG [Cryomorpha ignava]|uniref:Ribosomal RNA small subunit methyltransferase G n=1 Tax=Cryomorpha ignava TaxID=101383 RepID=A0A7K3WNX7_9FLAO|nr:16S rRNA (guanine(527)-N(7))-methyltransferase RsmG [Cryomorpha ignava]NEN22731.1 16S rRNA (guanine(527)-N(7))-methyltransferase RsmG [Cryomorpha ignava]
MDNSLSTYFPDLNQEQKERFAALKPLYEEWNAQINVISRKDMDHFYERHVLHSLALALYWKPKPEAKAIDIGTGGGFPGIPLAILYPEVNFLLVDSIGKKIKVVNEVAAALGLKNVTAIQERAENIPGKFDAVLTRAVSRLNVLIPYCINGKMKAKTLWCLKGGDLREEVEEIDRYPSVVYKLGQKIPGEFFETKQVVFVQLG